MKTESIQVENIKCHGCANSIRTNMEKLDGVQNVSVDIQAGIVTIDHIEKLQTEEFTRKLDSLGYPLSGSGNLFTKAKSYLSCAKGRMLDTD